MGQIKKICVAMICHFSNADVRSHLPLDNRILYTFVRKLLRMPTKGGGYGDIALWNVAIIDELKNNSELDLHIISAHSGLKKSVVSYLDDNVHYNFVRCDYATMLKKVIRDDDLWRKLNPMVKKVHDLIRQIRPDLVLLVGLENAYYSSTVLGIKGVPVYGLCQTIYNNPERAAYGLVDKKNATTEMKIVNEHKYFGVYCRKHFDLLRQITTSGVYIFKFGFPSKGELLIPIPTKKEFDFVNFAMGMSVKKGYPDSIAAIAIVKKKYPNVKLNLVGGGSAETKVELAAMAERLGVSENVIFTPFFEKKSDLFLHIQKSKFAVLPCKLDNTSGTMSQSMQLGLPIVVYKTSGTPSFNREKLCALIAEKDNVNDLARQMISLMDNPELAETLRRNAREYQEKKAEDTRKNGDRLVENFRAIVANYREGIPIPQEQLYIPENDD